MTERQPYSNHKGRRGRGGHHGDRGGARGGARGGRPWSRGGGGESVNSTDGDKGGNISRGGSGRGRGNTRGRGGQTRGASRGGHGPYHGGRGGGRLQSSGKLHRLNIDEILTMRSKDPEDIVTILEQDLKGFQVSLAGCHLIKGSDKVKNYTEAIIEIMFKVTRVDDESSNIVMAEFLSGRCSSFHIQLCEYIPNMNIHDRAARNKSLYILKMLCVLCKFVLRSFPTSWNVLPVKELQEVIDHDNFPELVTVIESIAQQQASIKRAERQSSKSNRNDSSHFDDWDNSQYRHMPILPTVKEVTSAPPPLRSNIVKGHYTDWEHYYDVQFRLLREDFISPLRKGIEEFKSPNRTHRLNDVYIYKNVLIRKPVCTLEGVCFEINFDVSRMRLYRSWEHSKRLMFGSLLCFSTDHFTRVIHFATVVNREAKDLEKGIFLVRFENPLEMLPHMQQQTLFVVAESKAFFEASRHTLRSLQTAEVGTMPFSQYLVLNQPTPVNPPKYFESSSAEYNLKWLYTEQHRRYCGSMFRNASEKIHVLDDPWPTSADPGIELDQSQLDAIKMALTQEIAIIQGPPGTGKTYIGYKIVQTLLENRNVWDPYETSPILVMCYTNHALDQFLEGIIHLDISSQRQQFHPRRRHRQRDIAFEETRRPNIVRIGSRSQSEEIQKCSLREVRSTYYQREYRDVKELKTDCKKHGGNIEWNNEQIESISCNPVNDKRIGPDGMKNLKPFIFPSHFYQLTQLTDQDELAKYTMEMWLGIWTLEERKQQPSKQTNESLPVEAPATLVKDGGIDKVQSDKFNNDRVQLHTQQQHEESNDEENEESIYVKGEAEIEQEIRKVDGDDYKRIQAVQNITEPTDALTKHLEKSTNKEVTEDQDEAESENLYTWKRKKDYEVRQIISRINQCSPADEEPDDGQDITDPSFSLEERYRLLLLWIKKYEQSLINYNQTGIIDYDQKCKEYKRADQGLDRVALENAEVIGMTTTGAAKYQHIIHLVKPKIVIVEEAAELLESHIVSALNGGTQHLILIGDHKQLRPKPNEYDLAMKHNLHISLFERLILNGHPHATLEIQHRMRPQISRLVRTHVYDTLIDHESVTEYDDVKGFCKNMYFFHHEHEEQHDENLSSHSNDYEADFIVSLCKHLLNLQYSPSQITILTGYTGQLLNVKSKMPKRIFQGVRIVNIDNFQGEENDIIILSLVRNNNQGKVGFLKEENRVCVALSRARMGLFCFGNFKLLCEEVPIWKNIMAQVKEEGCLGSAFPLQCPNHKHMKCDVSEPKQFAIFAPAGGCTTDCQERLDCGHSCKRICHVDDPNHEDYRCMERCGRLCAEGEHKCSASCYKPCPPCRVPVYREMPICGHIQKMECCEDLWAHECEMPCTKLCSNNEHICPLKCGQSCKKCNVHVERVMPGCGHEQVMKCYEKPENIKCQHSCEKTCPNGHPCQKLCWKDCGNCEIKFLKKLPNCSHLKKLACHIDPALSVCKRDCSHVYPCKHKCPKKCYEECDDVCNTPVLKLLECGHTDLIPCDLDPGKWSCTNPCERELECGHTCKQKCGERCSSVCTEQRTIQLECGHNFTGSCHQVTMAKKYTYLMKIECTEQCERELKCGHKCTNRCCDPCIEKCKATIVKKCPKGVHKLTMKCGDPSIPSCDKPCQNKLSCGHQCKKKCREKCDDSVCDFNQTVDCACGHKHKAKCSEKMKCNCQKKCLKVLKCGHQCQGKCGECFTRRIHHPCIFEVHVKRYCGHYRSVPCFGLEDKCTEVCSVASCPHSLAPCRHECHEPCDTECTEPCTYQCKHIHCTNPCSQPCMVSGPCNKPCDKQLDCGHNCMGICGEKCLTTCLICDRKKFISSVDRGLKQQGKKAAQKPESAKYLVLTCGHVFTVNYLDDYYCHHSKGKNRLVSPLLCPVCSKIIECSRYVRMIRERQQEIREVKEKSDRKELNLASKCTALRTGIKHLPKVPSLPSFGQSDEGNLALDILIKLSELYEQLRENVELSKLAIQLLRNALHPIIKNSGKLSLQFIGDITREVYRINLLYMVDKVEESTRMYPHTMQDSRIKKEFAEVQQLIRRVERDSSDLTRDVYAACVARLKKIYTSVEHDSEGLRQPVDMSSLPAPVITKRNWYRCAARGHYYFVPAKYQMKGIPDCEHCKLRGLSLY